MSRGLGDVYKRQFHACGSKKAKTGLMADNPHLRRRISTANPSNQGAQELKVQAFTHVAHQVHDLGVGCIQKHDAHFNDEVAVAAGGVTQALAFNAN